MKRRTKRKAQEAAEFFNIGHKQRRDRALKQRKQRDREWREVLR